VQCELPPVAWQRGDYWLWGGGQCLGDNRKIGFREGSIFVGEISIDLRDLPHELYLSGLPEVTIIFHTSFYLLHTITVKGLWRGQGGRKREDRV